MSYVLDTNAVALLMKADPNALAHLKRTPKHDVRLPQPVAAEVAYGIARLPRSKRRSHLLERWKLFADELRRLEWSDAVSEHFGLVKATLERRGELIEDFDVAIAAHALAHQAILVTNNQSHFRRIKGLRLEDWSKT